MDNFTVVEIVAMRGYEESIQCCDQQGPDVGRPISVNPRLNFNPRRFLFLFSKLFFRTIFSLLFRASNHQIVGKKNKTEFTS